MNHEGYGPRRLGHAVRFFSDSERSVDFGSRICGVERAGAVRTWWFAV